MCEIIKKTGNKLAVETYLTNLEFRAKIFGLTLISVTQKNNFDFNQNEMHFIYGLVNVLVENRFDQKKNSELQFMNMPWPTVANFLFNWKLGYLTT